MKLFDCLLRKLLLKPQMHVISTEARITSNHVISTETAGSPASALYSLGCKRSEVERPLYLPFIASATKPGCPIHSQPHREWVGAANLCLDCLPSDRESR